MPTAKIRKMPGYFQVKWRVKLLRNYQDLVRHHQRWGHEIGFAAPLAELLPPGTRPEHQHAAIEHEISRNALLVYHALNEIGIKTAVTFTNRPGDKRQQYDMIGSYFTLPQGSQQESFELIIKMLNEGIGFYEAQVSPLKRRLFNPFHWLVLVARLPVTILEHAGLAEHEAVPAAFLRIYSLVWMALLIILISLLCLKLGLSIPWQAILDKV